jgi:Zn-dependent protease with chaperone function
MARKARFLAASALFITFGTAAPAAQQPNNTLAVWALTPAQWQSGIANGIRIGRGDGTGVTLKAAHLKNLYDAQLKVARASNQNVPIVFVDDAPPNGFASIYNNAMVVAITPSMVELVGDDDDAVAAMLGHENAHHKLGHTADTRNSRERNIGAARSLFGGLANNLIGGVGGAIAGAAAGAAVTGLGRSFTRDEERAADAQGLEWAVTAGYEACGNYRLAQKLQMVAGGGLAFLSTHPGPEERMANANARAIALTGRGCDAPPAQPTIADAVQTGAPPAPTAAAVTEPAPAAEPPAGGNPYAPAGAAGP